MIKSIQELTDLELRVLILKVTGNSSKDITKCLKISDYKLRKIISEINSKCETDNLITSIVKLTKANII